MTLTLDRYLVGKVMPAQSSQLLALALALALTLTLALTLALTPALTLSLSVTLGDAGCSHLGCWHLHHPQPETQGTPVFFFFFTGYLSVCQRACLHGA